MTDVETIASSKGGAVSLDCDNSWASRASKAAASISLPFRRWKRRKRRQNPHIAATAVVDRRSLRATGRTEHLNFKAKPSIKAALADHVGRGKQSVWLEEAIIEKFRAQGIEIEL
jgi:hypothetical protein